MAEFSHTDSFSDEQCWKLNKRIRNKKDSSPGYAPGTIAVNGTWMERGFNVGQMHSSIPIYLQPFTSYSEILVGNCKFFLPPLHLSPPLGCSHWNSGKKFGPMDLKQTRIMGLPGSGDSLTIGWAVLTQYRRDCDGQTDRRTDVQSIAITCAVWQTLILNINPKH